MHIFFFKYVKRQIFFTLYYTTLLSVAPTYASTHQERRNTSDRELVLHFLCSALRCITYHYLE